MKKKTILLLTGILFLAVINSCNKDGDESNNTIYGEIMVLQPTGESVWNKGTEQFIKWTDNINDNMKVDLYKGESFIQSIVSNTSEYLISWIVSSDLTPGIDYQIRVSSTLNSNIYDISDYFEISGSTIEKVEFVAKWIVQNKSISTGANLPIKILHGSGHMGNNNLNSSKFVDPNLDFFKPDDWSNEIVIKNKDNNGYANCYDDEVAEGESAYIYFTFGNNTSVSILDPFYIGIYFDGEYVDELFLESEVIPPYGGIQWAYTIVNQTAGQHEVRIVLDHQDDINESNENDNEGTRTFTVLSAGAAYESFELLLNRYFITKNDGSFIIGPLSYNGNELELTDFGTMSIISIDDHNISFELSTEKDGSKTIINAYKSSEVQSTDMTSLLTPITWRLVASDCPGLEDNGKWTFASSGTYWFELANGTTYQKSWEYANETTINYGPYGGLCNGVANITSISSSELHIVDDVPYYYDFVPN